MAFTIDCFKADSNDNIVSVDWKYTTADGSLGNTHVLATPAGDFALAAVTQSTLIGWLEDQLGNTAAEFDAHLAERKADREYKESLTKYSKNMLNRYTTDAPTASTY